MVMGSERKGMSPVAAMMLSMVFSDPELLKAAYAMAASENDEVSQDVAEFYKLKAMQIGVTEEELQKSLETAKMVNEFLDELLKKA
jgi:hypothetical protein